ncbi:flagellar basal body rod protein FlgB [uncultured Lentibacter sp.]|jgi:flagellar basal-body rod protein FlgB|uniref:flagellar basal body rod protein FlgB n=1 Tax=uncultured Lentibacter sp. TaxID=1659309 RepID=UPI00262EAE09|nr:flagellar basal body rod protein FlgB [uncultured Lentibacter sp.]
MDGIRQHFGIHDEALALRSKRNTILASNIANAATPNFKARDVDFEATLAKALPGGLLSTSDDKHVARPENLHAGRLQYRDPVNPALDGNTVELAVEQMEFSENVVRYQTSLTFLNRKVSGLMAAIKGE